jgi:DNA mismatch endonuclease (patch repair protein)
VLRRGPAGRPGHGRAVRRRARKARVEHGARRPPLPWPVWLGSPRDNLRTGHMTDTLTKAERSERMSRVRYRDTKPEMLVRRLVHGLGFRYRLHASELPGRPDVVFRPVRKAIFVHGCFWHRHPGCSNTRWPKSKLAFWRPKLLANRRRDLRDQRRLRDLGWQFLVIWECEIRERRPLTKRLGRFLGG